MDIYRILQELCIELSTEKKDEFSAQCQMRGKNLLYALCSVREWNEAMDGSSLKVSRTAISEILASVDRTVGNLNRVIPEEIHVFGYSPENCCWAERIAKEGAFLLQDLFDKRIQVLWSNAQGKHVKSIVTIEMEVLFILSDWDRILD